MLKQFKSRSLRVDLCGQYVNHFQGEESGLLYFHRLFCYDSTCPVCNSKGGPIHKRRKLNMREKIKKSYGTLEGLAFRKFVLTLPSEVRCELLSRDDLNSFIRLVEKVMRSFYPNRMIYFSIHLFGDRDLDFKPHVNAYVVERLNVAGGCKMCLSTEELETIKNAYLMALNNTGYDVAGVVVHYGFTLKASQFFHSMKYFSRPCPDYDLLMRLADENPSLYAFLISDEMKGFQYIRCSRGKVAADQYLDGAGIAKKKMERLWFLGRERFYFHQFVDEWRDYERVEILPGVYACRSGGLLPGDEKFLKDRGLLDDLPCHNNITEVKKALRKASINEKRFRKVKEKMESCSLSV